MISYVNCLKEIKPENLKGFFVNWPNPPCELKFLQILNQSYKIVLAIENKRVVGFITSISDGILSAYIPLLEVLPDYQSKGIGKELVKKMKKELSHLYMIDLLCDDDLVSFYEKLGMNKSTGLMIRNYENQNGNSISSSNFERKT